MDSEHSTYGLLLCCREAWGGHHPILLTASQGGRIETSEFTYLYRGKLINCCNGLCIEAYCRRRIPYITNPATKQSFIIPSLPQNPSRVERFGYLWRLYYLSTGTFLSLLVGDNRDLSWDVWGMKSETGEWRKVLPDIKLGSQKCRLQPSAGKKDQVLEPFGWVKYPEVLALRFRGENRTCIFYNLDTHEINSTELPYSCSSYNGFVHKNSLVWLS
ncbi:uncharacterized protein LOC130994444 [Salvia miltiorrhiza]|uniref:uncharacterized protein LOC130994444 n=1 Tax=Salvia miltiorrhiza TaxID=226208 RepID=UPI0025AD0BD1|nr:uncharacterized protein LOC130994444 [Salvia miltiorrhiza]